MLFYVIKTNPYLRIAENQIQETADQILHGISHARDLVVSDQDFILEGYLQELETVYEGLTVAGANDNLPSRLGIDDHYEIPPPTIQAANLAHVSAHDPSGFNSPVSLSVAPTQRPVHSVPESTSLTIGHPAEQKYSVPKKNQAPKDRARAL